MRAGQYMYTCWRNAPNRGYSTYSFSSDVTQDEGNVIQIMAKYVAPRGLPYDPTPEEIEKLFPKNFSYGRLPSGRYFMAQTSYVGHEFKDDETGRMGNYLIHAYVFDENPALQPASFIGSKIFRSNLTHEEWAATNPPPLPQVELPDAEQINAAEVSKFLAAENRKEKFKPFLQAVIDSFQTGKHIFYSDVPENTPLWMKAVALCLPHAFMVQNTFNTFCAMDFNTNIKITPDCKMNLVELTSGGLTDLRQKAASGETTFDLAGAPTATNVGRYANEMTELFVKDVYRALACSEQIGKIVAAANVSADEAFEAYRLMEGDYAFGSASELERAYRIAAKCQFFNAAGFANGICAPLTSGKWGGAEVLSSFIKELYPVMNENNKIAIRNWYLAAFRAQGGNERTSLATRFQSFAPFPLSDYLFGYFKDGAGLSYFRSVASDPFLIYLYTESALLMRGETERAFGANTVVNLVYAEIDYYAKNNPAFAECICELASKADAVNVVCYVQKTLDVLGANPTFGEDKFFEYVKRLASRPDMVQNNLERYLAGGLDQNKVARYSAFMQDARFAPVDKALRLNPKYEPFFTEVDKYAFSRAPMDAAMLERYYREFCLTGRDKRNEFPSMLQTYLSGAANRAEQAYLLYQRLAPLGNMEENTFMVLATYAFENSVAETEKLISSPTCSENYKKFAAVARIRIPLPTYAAVCEGLCLPDAPYDKKNPKRSPRVTAALENCESAIMGNGLYAFLEEERAKRDNAYEKFVAAYLPRTFYLAEGLSARDVERNKQNPGWNFAYALAGVFEKVFGPLVSVFKFDELFKDVIDNVYKEKEEFAAHLLIYVLFAGSAASQKIGKLLEGILEEMRGKRKAVFKRAILSCGDKEKAVVEKYVKEYEINHTHGLFSFFKRK